MNSPVIIGDCRAVLPTLEAGSVQTCVTSPPYWGLRDYGTAKWEGGDPAHDHDRVPARGGRGGSGSPGKQTIGATPSDFAAAQCSCGAVRNDCQIGLESTPAEYVEKMVAVFREVRRVLRDDGTLWLNLGDSYSGSGPSGASYQSATTKARSGQKRDGAFAISDTLAARGLTYAEKKPIPAPGLKAKDLVGIPWRVAFALQADGWYLRQDIIWHKPNPMPESVRDRCTKAHEYIFLLAKSERYYYDADAIAEESRGRTDMGVMNREGRLNEGGKWCTPEPEEKSERNKRSVWTVTTQPFKEAHFATFPPALIEPCILAGCPVGGTVLDPFGGSGTTGQVAEALGRKWLLIELNGDYAQLAADRTRQVGMELACGS